MDNQKETKGINEKPVKIPLPFKDALAVLLETKLIKEKQEEKEEQVQKKPSD